MNIFYIGIGGAMGAITRYLFTMFIDKIIMTPFPIGILLINAIGSFFVSLLFFLGEAWYPPHIKIAISVGFLGAFTTFSTYSLQSFEMFRRGQWIQGSINIILNNGVALLFVLLGMLCAMLISMSVKK